MAFYEWNQQLSVQVAKFDEQHKKLIRIINELYEGLKAGQAAHQMSQILDKLDSYTREHFTEEERLMQQAQYPGLTFQKQAHALFIRKIGEFREQFKNNKISTTLEVMKFLKEWLTRHIMETDKRYGPHFNSRGIK